MKWIKWYPTDWLHSTCRDELTPAERATFHDYVCMASMREPIGEFRISTWEGLARQLNTPLEIIEKTTEKCIKYNRIFIEEKNNEIFVKIINYLKYQSNLHSHKPLLQANVNKKSNKSKKLLAKSRSRLDKIRLDKTRKEKKKEINKEKKIVVFSLPEWIEKETWEAYLEMRNNIKKPPKQKAIELAIGKLEKLRNQGHDPKKVLEESILNGWAGVFPLRKEEEYGRLTVDDLK